MIFNYDDYGNILQNRIYLANPQKNYIGELTNVNSLKVKRLFNGINEVEFVIYEYENDERNEFYDDILEKKLIEVQYMGWFEINQATPTLDEGSPIEYKSVKAVSLESKLINKNIDDINGVFALYDVIDTSKSLLHIISSLTNWSIGHVDNELIGKKRTFSIDTARIYNLLTTDISKSFECIFKFNTYEKTINAYVAEDYGKLTDIVIHGSNVLKSYNRVANGDDIVTRIKVVGGDGLDIRSVNPSRTNYLTNISYFLNEKWMSRGLIDAYDNYNNAYHDSMSSYITNRDLLKSKYQELNALNVQLRNIEMLKKQQEEIQGTHIQMHGGTPPINTPEYEMYLQATNNIALYITQIVDKKVEINSKQAEIDSVQDMLESISETIKMENYFTTEQLDELDEFLIESDTYEDSTFTITDIMTDAEVIDMKIELMNNGNNELKKVSRPQFTDSITINNLFNMIDNADSPISYKELIEDMEEGNLITIIFRDDYYVTARLMQMDIDFDNLKDINVVFSTKSRLDTAEDQLSEMIANADKSSRVISLAKIGYDEASKQRNTVREFMNGALDATTNAMHNNDRVETELGKYGIKNKKWLEDENRYSDYMSWWNQNTLLFSSDGFKTSQAGIGLFTTEGGEKFYGILAPVIVGDLVMTSALKIINEANSVTIDKDGASFIDCDITINKDENTIYISADKGFELVKNGVPQFYIDSNGNAMFRGFISVTNDTNTINIDGEKGIEILKGTEKVLYLDTDGNINMRGNLSVTNNINTVNINGENGFEIVKNSLIEGEEGEKIIYLDTNGDANFLGNVTAKGGKIAGFNFDDDETKHLTGFYYMNPDNGKYMRISPINFRDGDGEVSTRHGSIDLGYCTSMEDYSALIHLRSDGYARFGKVSDIGSSLRFNDFLRWEETSYEKGSDTIVYSQNFRINTDGTVRIKSPDIPKPTKSIDITSDKLTVGFIGGGGTSYDLKRDASGLITKMTSDDGVVIKLSCNL